MKSPFHTLSLVLTDTPDICAFLPIALSHAAEWGETACDAAYTCNIIDTPEHWLAYLCSGLSL